MKYNIIGDIHGRTCWKDLVQDDCINIFVGDYFAPYHNISLKQMLDNFQNIIEYKHQHPETILLIGNHDIDFWYINEKYSRYNELYYHNIYNILEENKNSLQAAYSIENKVLVSHAGASIIWYERNKDERKQFITHINLNYDIDSKSIEEAEKKSIEETYHNAFDWKINKDRYLYPNYYKIIDWNNKFWLYDYKNKIYFELKTDYTPDNIANFINKCWKDKKYSLFNFKNNANTNDYYGESETHGPMWIRPQSLIFSNIFRYSNYWQVIGHTMMNKPVINNDTKLVFCDCLEYNNMSVIFNSDTNEWHVNKQK